MRKQTLQEKKVSIADFSLLTRLNELIPNIINLSLNHKMQHSAGKSLQKNTKANDM
jgi:hypothetical protein